MVAICAGRTDSGVHAAGQVIHFDTDSDRTARAWVLGANTQLSPAIALQWAGEVGIGFHARHRAVRRIYRYCILNRSARSALQRTRAAWIHRRSTRRPCIAAAQALIGEHDFSAFRSVECQSKPRSGASRGSSVRREGDYLWLEIAANAYLHHMVRNIVGTLLEAQGESDPAGAPWRGCSRAAIGAAPARPRRPPACICGRSSTRRSTASPLPQPGLIALD